ncbi:antitermination protein NusG [Enterorhabdus sp. P55]|uniref:antitermination protein NusG n=1 Tax=Enterorhabdus sp. P55 TaxID=2304571 RepID=UPI001368D026|nr:antitermination protein NusG [Enterorhabdus sp. P55]
MQVVPSREDAAARRVMALGGDAVRACFPLRRQMPRKTAGEWGIATDLLFPGYLFLASDDPEAVAHVLRRSTQPDLMLSADGALAALTDAEAALVHALGGAEGVVRVSRGAIEGGRLAVASGPLAGLEGLVCHVDRHRRAAWLDPSRADEVLLGRAPGVAAGTLALPADARGLKVGLEVVSKS